MHWHKFEIDQNISIRKKLGSTCLHFITKLQLHLKWAIHHCCINTNLKLTKTLELEGGVGSIYLHFVIQSQLRATELDWLKSVWVRENDWVYICSSIVLDWSKSIWFKKKYWVYMLTTHLLTCPRDKVKIVSGKIIFF